MQIALLQSRADFARQLAQLACDCGHTVDPLVAPAPRIDRIKPLLQNRYDVIQVDETVRGGVIGALVSLARGIPLVLYFRGWTDYTNEHGEYGPLMEASIRTRTKFVLRAADEVVYISETCRDRIRDEFPAPEGRIISRPFDISEFERGARSEETVAANDELTLLTVTNLRYEGKYQGITTTLEACEPLFEEYDLRYRIAGGGAYLEALQSYVGEYDHSAQVDVLGFRDDIAELLAAADVFVYVSYNDAYPTAVLEAQAAGLPIVAGDAVGVPEAVGGAGLVCEPNQEALRECLHSVISDADYRDALAEQSRNRMDGYNEAIAEQFIDLWGGLRLD